MLVGKLMISKQRPLKGVFRLILDEEPFSLRLPTKTNFFRNSFVVQILN